MKRDDYIIVHLRDSFFCWLYFPHKMHLDLHQLKEEESAFNGENLKVITMFQFQNHLRHPVEILEIAQPLNRINSNASYRSIEFIFINRIIILKKISNPN